MNRFKFLLFVSFIILALFTNCNKDEADNEQNTTTLRHPIAAFSYSGNDQPAPTTVHFNNNSQYANIYRWSFGDNAFSTEKNPRHTYYNTSGNPKLFNVTLTAEDTTNGLTNTKTRSVQILPQ